MKNTMLRSLSLLGISLLTALSVAAQDVPKVKSNEKETKVKTEDMKIKDKKDEVKYKTDQVKIKDKKDEEKYKSEDLKMKDKKDERKVKANVKPMRPSSTSRTEIKTGETHVMTKEHIAPAKATPVEPEPTVAQEVTVPAVTTTAAVKKTTTHRHTARKTTAHKPVAARKTNTGVKYVVRTKVVKDTVYVPSQPERIVTVDTAYVHDTVSMTRVDTVVQQQKENTYSGYNVPKGDFKKVKLKKDKNTGEVRMKRKEKDDK